ncbi:MAG: Gfo/Idh/MocA family oxidoreductase [Rhodothermales bacterium]|nr:Gfo/Idh/MocA family oxidoreductase [Rhodothermales bacterium]MBO6779906.1 Gfo/Idh/MocA family oxidoreductase [Rhodothermales bacterium]
MDNGSNGANEGRRDFLKKSAVVATAAMAGVKTAKAASKVRTNWVPATGSVLGANDRLVIGHLGVGGQGFNAHMRTVSNADGNGETFHNYDLNAVSVAACDLYSGRRDRAKELMEYARQNRGAGDVTTEVYEDYRAILDRDDIDAVMIGAVDHWHAQMAIDALDAGKHVYCEKPMTRYLDEGFAVYDAVQRTGKKFQIGSQYCTEGTWHTAAEMIRNMMIGQLVLAQDSYMRNTPNGEWNYYGLEEDVTPETLDWMKWLGPVNNKIAFNREHYHRWRKYYPYCAGILGDLLAHRVHPMLIATGNPEFPSRVVSLGNKKITNATVGPDDRSVNDNTQLIAEFPSGLNMIIAGATVNEQGLGSVIRGNEGTLYFGSGGSVELRPERPFADLVDQETVENITPGVSIPAHVSDWLEAIRNDGTPNGNIEVAMRAQTIISLAEMSDRLGEMMHFDEATREVRTGSGRVIEPITYGTLEAS